MNLSESKDFPVSTASLKEVRVFSREVFEKINLPQDQKDELVLALLKLHKILLSMAIKELNKLLIEWKLKSR